MPAKALGGIQSRSLGARTVLIINEILINLGKIIMEKYKILGEDSKKRNATETVCIYSFTKFLNESEPNVEIAYSLNK
jgi:hypothetical protein